ncbi:erythromycin esterase family protein [Hymenobacter endophyticus]|uniref:Erythromycin esterase family protein n=1 Tax=Hymenobacter endophyticus TaxID=3076335 RepID=A0ABU3TNE5_9BACT|nr:erythromycin esterase family protein [Hymenobacter endophyticus]MDU0372869.1 erythromycin esterase family protein [Hymenobacter endophyticus]
MRYLCLLLLLVSVPQFGRAQARLNLSFEPEANRHQPFLLWHTRVPALPARVLRLDTLTPAASGRGSLLLDVSQAEEPVGGAVYTSISPIDSLRGHTVTISGQLRTRNFTGKAFLYAHAQAATTGDNLASHDDFSTPALPPSSDWQRVQIQLPVPAGATSLLLGLRFLGQGRVWLDDVRVEWDSGQRYPDQLLPGTEPLVLSAAARQPNWDFERRPAALPDPRYRTQPDSATPTHGRYSLRLEPTRTGIPTYAYLGQTPLDSSLRGKTLVVQGQLRYAAATSVPALYYTLLAESNGPEGRRGARGPLQELPLTTAAQPGTGWQPFRVEVPTTWNAYYTQLVLGLRLAGPGPVWVDNVQLLVNGKPYAPPPDPAAPTLPTAAELAWLRQAAVPLRTALPDAGDNKDLAALGTLVGKTQVIGLGETTYGSREIAQLRHRLLRYLIEQKGLRTVALEADAAACLALNDYLQTGQGNPRQLVQALGSYNSPETLALVQWLRTCNERATTKVQVWGLECRQPAALTAYLREMLPERATTLRARLDELGRQLQQLPAAEIRLNPFTEPGKTAAQLTAARAAVHQIRTVLEEQNRLSGSLLLPEAALQRQLLVLLEQFAGQHTLDSDLTATYRANTLAENIYWLHQQAPDGRLAVLAHNSVLAATNGTGQRLRATYGPDYVALGTAFNAGSFRTEIRAENGSTSFRPAVAAAAEPGSYEYYFQAARLPLTYLNLRTASLTAGTQWLHQNLLLRDVGYALPTTQFLRHDLRREFDALLFLPTTTALQPLP